MTRHYLGIDSSTQGVKALVIDPENGRVVGRASVSYGIDLPQYGCPDGVLPHADPLVKHSNPLLWLAALDLLLARLRESAGSLADVVAIGGDGQQHGSVYLRERFAADLAGLSKNETLASQLAPALARSTSPIWMDSSTTQACCELMKQFGTRLQRDTGSPAIERFTGPQIRKFAQEESEHYAQTARIHLVSSFLCSVLIGADAPLDTGDGAGMNLLNLKTQTWDDEITEFSAPSLRAKLPRVATGVAGKLHPYFEKYGLQAGLPVAVWTGDNPASLIGTGACRSGMGVVSLGTSDTLFAAFDNYRTDPDGYGHVFGNPAGGFMSLTCFKNGSLARDRLRQEAGLDWTTFDRDVFGSGESRAPEHVALPWFTPEITPLASVPGLRAHFNWSATGLKERIRAAVWGQFLSMRRHTAWIGNFSTLRVTGGGSQSAGIRQILADVFQARVATLALTDSAALGSAMLAAQLDGFSLEELGKTFAPVVSVCEPDCSKVPMVDRLLLEIEQLESEPAAAGCCGLG